MEPVVTVEVADADLIARAREGDDRAYGMLVARHQPVAFRTAYVITRPRRRRRGRRPGGVHQGARRDRGFRAGAPFRPWLLTIVANEARNRRRSAVGGWRSRAASPAAESRAPVPLPEAAALAGDDRRELAAAIARLAPTTAR